MFPSKSSVETAAVEGPDGPLQQLAIDLHPHCKSNAGSEANLMQGRKPSKKTNNKSAFIRDEVLLLILFGKVASALFITVLCSVHNYNRTVIIRRKKKKKIFPAQHCRGYFQNAANMHIEQTAFSNLQSHLHLDRGRDRAETEAT